MNPQLLFLGSASGNPPFSLEAQTFINMILPFVNFVLLAVLMTYLLYKPVRKILQARADRVAGELNDAETNNAKARELRAEYEKKVKDIELERASILDEARKQAAERRAQMIEDAKAEAHGIKERAARDILTEREQIKDAVYEAIIDISTDMAAKLISVNVDRNAHDRLFAEAMTELEATAFRQETVV